MLKKILIPVFIFILGFYPVFSSAKTFNPNYVLSDPEYLDSNSMSAGYIQEFLKAKGSGLANIVVNVFGKTMKVAEIFYQAAKTYCVSQKLLIATAQKEQNAITDSTLSSDQLDKLMGFGVYQGNDYSTYLGIYNQITYAAKQFRKYYDYPENYTWQMGVTKTTSDGVVVTPQNKATAGLYNYTPYAGALAGTPSNEEGNGGNFLFWKIWQDWFLIRHPSGTLIREEGKSGVYFLLDGKKRPFWSKKVFDYVARGNGVIEVTKNEIEGYTTANPMKFPDGTLLQAPQGGVYIVENGKKRPFKSREAFDKLGYKTRALVQVDENELNWYPRGEPIDIQTDIHPSGTVVKLPNSAGIYLIENGKKRLFKDRRIFENRYSWNSVIEISLSKLQSYPSGPPVLFKDGTLIRDEAGNIFVIEKGLRRHIERPSVFWGLGYKMENVISVPNWIVLMHPGGEPIRGY
jgi:hypothetical protein